MKKLVAPLVALAVIGAPGLALIKDFEGVRYKPYRDPVGIATVCYGHTGKDVDAALILGTVYTPAQCDAILVEDIRVHRAGLNKCVRVTLNENQWDALTSFAFNLGVAKACGSTLVRYVNAGRFYSASLEFPKWNKAGGTVLRGLSRRREAERALFVTPPTAPGYTVSTANVKALAVIGQ